MSGETDRCSKHTEGGGPKCAVNVDPVSTRALYGKIHKLNVMNDDLTVCPARSEGDEKVSLNVKYSPMKNHLPVIIFGRYKWQKREERRDWLIRAKMPPLAEAVLF